MGHRPHRSHRAHGQRSAAEVGPGWAPGEALGDQCRDIWESQLQGMSVAAHLAQGGEFAMELADLPFVAPSHHGE